MTKVKTRRVSFIAKELSYYALYAEFLNETDLKILPSEKRTRLDLKIALIPLYMDQKLTFKIIDWWAEFVG
jgi:hypothetical protein